MPKTKNKPIESKFKPASDLEKELDFYQAIGNVYLVWCLRCEQPIAIEYETGNPSHPYRCEVVPVRYPKHPLGMLMLSSRVRLDNNMGYECLCGNDTRLAKAERGRIPQSRGAGGVPVMSPWEKAAIQEQIDSNPEKADVEMLDARTMRVESFKRQKVRGK